MVTPVEVLNDSDAFSIIISVCNKVATRFVDHLGHSLVPMCEEVDKIIEVRGMASSGIDIPGVDHKDFMGAIVLEAMM